MTANRPITACSTASKFRRDDAPASAATELAHNMLENGWALSSATVRVLHVAQLKDDSGLTVTVTSEAGKVRLDFNSEYRHLGGYLSRQAWHAESNRELPVELLAAVSSANTVASDDDPFEVSDLLTAAGWSRPYPLDQQWISPNEDRQVTFLDNELEYDPLTWHIHHRAGCPVTIRASADTPAPVIAALALTTFS